MREYKYTILFCIIVFVALMGLFGLIQNASDCEKHGGDYVRKWNGRYICVGEDK